MAIHFIFLQKAYNDVHIPVWRERLVGGKFGEFGESSMIHQIKTIQISTYN